MVGYGRMRRSVGSLALAPSKCRRLNALPTLTNWRPTLTYAPFLDIDSPASRSRRRLLGRPRREIRCGIVTGDADILNAGLAAGHHPPSAGRPYQQWLIPRQGGLGSSPSGRWGIDVQGEWAVRRVVSDFREGIRIRRTLGGMGQRQGWLSRWMRGESQAIWLTHGKGCTTGDDGRKSC